MESDRDWIGPWAILSPKAGHDHCIKCKIFFEVAFFLRVGREGGRKYLLQLALVVYSTFVNWGMRYILMPIDFIKPIRFKQSLVEVVPVDSTNG